MCLEESAPYSEVEQAREIMLSKGKDVLGDDQKLMSVKVLCACSYMDLRFRHLKFIGESQRKDVRDLIIDTMKTHCQPPPKPSSQPSSSSSQPSSSQPS